LAEPALLEWGVATRALEGQTESGDLAVVAPFPDGVLAGVVDGLGHGPEAARAARAAVDLLHDCAGQSLERLAQLSHEELKQTRGAVMSLAAFFGSTDTVVWLGLGNVQGRLIRRLDSEKPAFQSLPLVGGIVGYRMPLLRSVTLPVAPGDVLILATDGIRGNFSRPRDVFAKPADVAQRLLEKEMTGLDDALVMVVRYVGASP